MADSTDGREKGIRFERTGEAASDVTRVKDRESPYVPPTYVQTFTDHSAYDEQSPGEAQRQWEKSDFEQLTTLIDEVGQTQAILRTQIESVLAALDKHDFNTLKAKQKFVAKIKRLLAATDVQIEYPKCDKTA